MTAALLPPPAPAPVAAVHPSGPGTVAAPPFGKRSIMFLRRHVGLGHDDHGRDDPGGRRSSTRKSAFRKEYTLKDPLLVQVVDYWTAKKGERFAPARCEIDPLDLAPALGWLALIDVQRDPLRFRCRLHGTGLVEASRVEMTGRYIDEFPDPDHRDLMLSVLARVVETRHPWSGRSERILDGQRRPFEAVMLPLSDDGQQVTMALGGLRYA